MNPMVEARSLQREWGTTIAVRSLDLSVPRGSVFALVGPNGAGKTTLLRMIAGLLEPTSGEVRVDGLDARSFSREARAKLGFLPDFFGLYRDLTVEEYLRFFTLAYGTPAADRPARIREALARVGLADRGSSVVGTLSRGTRQRVAIARALIHDPPLLLLDEPAAGLDPEARGSLQQLFRALAGQGKTLIVSSHILAELEEYSTHVAMMQKGRLVASGAIGDFRKGQARARRVRVRFLGSASRVQSVLLAFEGVARVEPAARDCAFDFAGDDPALAALLAKLVESGARVTAFEPALDSMQDIYLSVMHGSSE